MCFLVSVHLEFFFISYFEWLVDAAALEVDKLLSFGFGWPLLLSCCCVLLLAEVFGNLTSMRDFFFKHAQYLNIGCTDLLAQRPWAFYTKQSSGCCRKVRILPPSIEVDTYSENLLLWTLVSCQYLNWSWIGMVLKNGISSPAELAHL